MSKAAMTALPYTSVFKPTSIASCILWLDGADTSTITGTTNVTQWTDKSGFSSTATTSGSTGTVSTAATGLYFNGTGYMGVPGIAGKLVNTPFVIFIVETLAGLNSTAPIVFGDNNPSYTYPGSIDKILAVNYRTLTNFTFSFFGDDLEDYSISGSGTTRIWAFYLPASANRTIRRNGAVDVTHTNNTRLGSFTNPTIGSAYGVTTLYYFGTISEIIIYNTDIGLSAIQQVEGYLAWKWGLQASLPSFPGVNGITGCTLWLDATDPAGTGVQPANGSTITVWVDKSNSGNSLGVYSGTSVYSTYESRSSIKLNSSTMYVYNNVNLSSYTVFYVGLQQTSVGNATPFVGLPLDGQTFQGYSGKDWNSTDGFGLYTDSSSFRFYGSVNSGGLGLNAVSFSVSAGVDNIPLVLVAFTETSVGYLTAYLNGTSVSTLQNTARTSTAKGFAIGTYGAVYGSPNSQGSPITTANISEIIVFTQVLTTTQRQQVEGYLAWKWGLQAQLPITHPYYGAAPTLHPYAAAAPTGPNALGITRAPAVAALVPTPKQATTALSYTATITPATAATGIQLWLDASDTTTTTVVTGKLTAWTDKSGKGCTVTVPTNVVTYKSAFLNGRATLGFAGNANITTTIPTPPGNGDYAVIAVWKPYSGGTYAAITMGPTSASPSLGLGYNGSYYNLFEWGQAESDYTAASGSYVIQIGTRVGGVKTCYINGLSAPTGTGTLQNITNGAVSIGGGDAFYITGEIAEIIIYTGTLTTSQRQVLEGYLAWKWGLQASLPSFTTPTSITGCQLWLDAADSSASSMTFSSGTTLATWKDKSGNNNTATAYNSPTLTQSAINGKQAVATMRGPYFQGPISITGTTYTLFTVATRSSGSYGNDTRLVSFAVNNSSPDYNTAAASIGLFSQPAAQTLGTYRGAWIASNAYVMDAPFVATINYSGTNGYMWFNGAAASTTGSASTGTFGITVYGLADQACHTSEYWNGYIGEVIMFSTSLTTTQIQQVEWYLASKWGITLSASHPYYSSSPVHSYAAAAPTGASLRAPAVAALVPTPIKGTTAIKKLGFLPYYQVDSTSWSSDWQPYLQQLAAANAGATVTTTNITGGASNAGGYSGAVLAPDGCIYFTPLGPTNILKLNVATGITTNITGTASYGGGWYGGVLGSDGNIYSAPFNASSILKLTVATGATTNITGGATYTISGWVGGAAGPDGNIYFMPFGAPNILKLTVATGVTTNITGGATFTSGGWGGGVLGPDGNIYAPPINAGNVLKFNVATGVTTNITGGASLTGPWFGGVLGPDGNIYCAPLGATSILKINVATGVTTNITGAADFSGGWVGGTLGPDGNVYFTPYGATTNILKLNVATGVTTNITGGANITGGWTGCALGPDGNIYFASRGATNILKLTFSGLSQIPKLNYCLSAYISKF